MTKLATEQETFDLVVNALITQGGPSLDEDHDTCMYRSPTGAKCAAGHLIPDELYDPVMEDKLSFGLPPNVFGVHKDNMTLIGHLQSTHDKSSHSSNFVENIKTSFAHIAKDFNLQYTP